MGDVDRAWSRPFNLQWFYGREQLFGIGWIGIDVIVDKGDSALIVFYGDTRGVFDEIDFESVDNATDALIRNGFRKYLLDAEVQEFIGLPESPSRDGKFYEQKHPNGRIYSSGRFWR